MAQYTVREKQNIFDIALHLYGSIEGLFDLLISNYNLNMVDNIPAGTTLEYHDYFVINQGVVAGMKEAGIMPANGERSVYYKGMLGIEKAFVDMRPDSEYAGFSISGDGEMMIDWGDNSPLENITLTSKNNNLEHYFDNRSDSRRVKLYGNFKIERLDVGKLKGNLFVMDPIEVKEFVSKYNDKFLGGLFLFKGTDKVDLERAAVTDLSPIFDMALSELNLEGALFKNPDALDDYLVNLVNNHQNRRACTVRLSQMPGQRGEEAIKTILGTPEWNTPTEWKFYINNELYTLESEKSPEDGTESI